MLNQVILVGRVVDTPSLKDLDGMYTVSTLTLAVVRPFKNMEGNFDTDFIKISLWNGIAQNASEYIKKGDIVGVKGRIAMKDKEVSFNNGEEVYKKKIIVHDIIGERVIFIHSARRKKEEDYLNNNEEK